MTHEPQNLSRPVFICGPSRSGTTLMSWTFRNQMNVAFVDETHYFAHIRKAYSSRLDRPLTESELDEFETYFTTTMWTIYRPAHFGKQALYNRIDPAVVRRRCIDLGGRPDDYFKAFCLEYHAGCGGAGWGEKTPRHVFLIDDILKAFPDAAIICMIRDPRAVVASFKDWHKNKSIVGEKGRVEKGSQRKRVERIFHPITISSLCKGAFRAAQSAVEKHGSEKVRIVRFEDLIESPVDILTGLAEWLEIDTKDIDPENMPVSNSSYAKMGERESKGMNPGAVDRWRKTLSPAQIRIVEKTTSKMMDDAGYELSNPSASPLSMAACYARFLPSVVRSVFMSRRRTGNLPSFLLERMRMFLRS